MCHSGKTSRQVRLERSPVTECTYAGRKQNTSHIICCRCIRLRAHLHSRIGPRLSAAQAALSNEARKAYWPKLRLERDCFIVSLVVSVRFHDIFDPSFPCFMRVTKLSNVCFCIILDGFLERKPIHHGSTLLIIVQSSTKKGTTSHCTGLQALVPRKTPPKLRSISFEESLLQTLRRGSMLPPLTKVSPLIQ